MRKGLWPQGWSCYFESWWKKWIIESNALHLPTKELKLQHILWWGFGAFCQCKVLSVSTWVIHSGFSFGCSLLIQLKLCFRPDRNKSITDNNQFWGEATLSKRLMSMTSVKTEYFPYGLILTTWLLEICQSWQRFHCKQIEGFVLHNLFYRNILSSLRCSSFKMVYLIGPDGLVNRRVANFQKTAWMWIWT